MLAAKLVIAETAVARPAPLRFPPRFVFANCRTRRIPAMSAKAKDRAGKWSLFLGPL